MAANRWQIGLGALILALMLLTAAFSLGVYVGGHGLSREGLRLSGPAPGGPALGGPAPGGPAPGRIDNQLRPPGLEAEPQVVGRVRAITPEGLELATRDGPRFVRLDESTQVEEFDGASAALTELSSGDMVAIFGELNAVDRRQLVATRIIRLPQTPPGQPAQP